MAEYFFAGSESQTITIFVADSSSTTGAGLAGLAFNTASLTAYYRKGATGSSTAVTLATQTVTGAWSSGGFVEIDATNMKGCYRFDVPNALIDTAGLTHVVLRGAANMVPVLLRLDCRAVPASVQDIATDAITAAAVKADAVTKIQSGLAGSSALATAQADLDIITGASGVNLLTATQASIDAIEDKTDQLSFSLAGQLDVSVHTVTSGGFDDIFQTYQVAESYPSIGVSPTPAQAILMSQQAFTNFSIASDVISVLGLDGVTVVGTWQMDSATRPLSRTRSS